MTDSNRSALELQVSFVQYSWGTASWQLQQLNAPPISIGMVH
ncbi:MAG: hypothetical protein ACK5GN_02640 [Pseudomonadota bacterium]